MIIFLITENQILYQITTYRKRKDLDVSKCERYEKSVQDVMATVAQMINPFEADQEELVSLATGAVLENDVADSLLRAEEIGEEQFKTFVQKNLLSEEPDIFTTLKKNKLPTFSSAKKTNVKDSKGKEITVKMNRNFFARLLILAKSRQIDLEEVLSYSLGVYPLSLATASGTFVKTAKSKLFEILESETKNSAVDISNRLNNALIVDAMAVLQTLKGNAYIVFQLSENGRYNADSWSFFKVVKVQQTTVCLVKKENSKNWYIDEYPYSEV